MICTSIDDFLTEKSYWFCTLSDGTSVYQDDNRPGYEEPRAWVRLGRYLKEHGLQIVSMGVKFRDHVERLPENCHGYYFAYGVSKDLTWGDSVGTFVLGYQESPDDNFTCLWYKYPELIVIDKQIKPRDKVSEPFGIYNG